MYKRQRSNNAALVLSFLGRVFVDNNSSDLPASVLTASLDEELYALNQRLGENSFSKTASAYLDDWASPDHGWLRKYYPAGSDEAHFDLAPAVEKALLWVCLLYTSGSVADISTRDLYSSKSYS